MPQPRSDGLLQGVLTDQEIRRPRLAARSIALLLPFPPAIEDLTLLEQGGDRARPLDDAAPRALDEQSSDARVDGERQKLLTDVRYRPALEVDRAKETKELVGLRDGARARRLEPPEGPRIAHAPRAQLEYGLREADAQDLRNLLFLQGCVLELAPESHHTTRAEPSGPSGSLGRRTLADAHRLEAIDPVMRGRAP